MNLARWMLLLLGSGAIVGYTVWWYRTREEPVATRGWAAGLRAAALITAWLILLNPSLPVNERSAGRGEVVLLDASHSMSRPYAAEEGSIWEQASDSARSHARVWLFGGAVPRYLPTDSLPAQPVYGSSRLAPAIRAAAAAGARRAVVLTDGRITDVAESVREAQQRGVAISIVDLERPSAELGISRVSAANWALSGDTVEVRAEVVARGVEADSVRVEVVDDQGRVRAASWIPVPEEERFAAAALAFAVAGGAGYRRFAVRLSADVPDLESRDDERPFYVRVTEQPAGPVLISLRPDWEPSFLIANLDRLTDAPTSAYLWLADSLLSLQAHRKVAPSVVSRRALAAPLLVLHGYGADAPRWARELVENASRLLVLPTGGRGFELPGWDIRVGLPAPGEWYVAAEVPSSPLALELGGIPFEELPPLVGVRTIDADRAWEPLALQRLRRGESRPAIVVGSDSGRRFAVAAAEGFWRWAFRPGPGRQLYRSLWTGVAGWLLTRQSRGHGGLEPRRRVVSRGEALRWTLPGEVDSLVVELLNEDAEEVYRGAAAVGDSLAVSLPPARYRYRARAYREGGIAAAGEGPVEVEAFSDELLPRLRSPLDELAASAAGQGTSRRSRGSRGLATLGWPYLILIALFCAEWAVRRFSGLR